MSAGTPELAPTASGETRRGFPWVRFAVVLLLVVADQASKSAIFQWTEWSPSGVADWLERDPHGHRRHAVLGDWLGVMPHTNKGAAFGQFQNLPHVLVVGRFLAVLCLTWLLWKAGRRPWALLWAMCLVLSGAIGNLVDNLWTGGSEPGHPYGTVRDFIDVWFLSDRFGWDAHFPTFNVADSCITVGAVLWILSGLFAKEEGPAPTPVEEPLS